MEYVKLCDYKSKRGPKPSETILAGSDAEISVKNLMTLKEYDPYYDGEYQLSHFNLYVYDSRYEFDQIKHFTPNAFITETVKRDEKRPETKIRLYPRRYSGNL